MENSLFWLVAACCLCLHSGLSHSASSCTETIWMRRLNRDISLFLWYRYNYCLILNTAGGGGFGSIVFKLNPSSNLIVESEPFSTPAWFTCQTYRSYLWEILIFESYWVLLPTYPILMLGWDVGRPILQPQSISIWQFENKTQKSTFPENRTFKSKTI